MEGEGEGEGKQEIAVDEEDEEERAKLPYYVGRFKVGVFLVVFVYICWCQVNVSPFFLLLLLC